MWKIKSRKQELRKHIQKAHKGIKWQSHPCTSIQDPRKKIWIFEYYSNNSVIFEHNVEIKKQKAGIEKAYSKSSLRYQVTVTSMHMSCPLVPANGISKSPGHLKIPNSNSKLRGKICFKYSRFEEKDSNIRIIFGLKNCRIWIRIFEIRGKRFESESNPNIFDHLWLLVYLSICMKRG